MEKHFLVLACPRCRVVQVADGQKKTRTCVSCNRRFEIAGIQVLGAGKDAREARQVAANIKAKPYSNQT